MDSDSSATSLVIATKKHRVKLFCKIYWKTIVIIVIPLILLPVAFLGVNDAYKSFYIFIVTNTFWILDVLHPGIVAMVPLALATMFGLKYEVALKDIFVDCLSVMILVIALEHSKLNNRVALKLLMVFGCSHYRLSLMLFFCCMFLSMLVTNTMACGLMMPIVKSVLEELEKMGILEIFQTIGKAKQTTTRHEISVPRPTDITVFYFLGIAYSASIGGMATSIGCEPNKIFLYLCNKIFPNGPTIEFPHYMLLNLPGVLFMEVLLYLWMNYYFVGMFRPHNEIVLEIGLSDEAEHTQALLVIEQNKLGHIRFHEIAVGAFVLLAIFLQASAILDRSHDNLWSPTIFGVTFLFIIPTNLKVLNFFKKGTSHRDLIPTEPGRALLNWTLFRTSVDWHVLFIVGGSCTITKMMSSTGMTDEFEKFLLLFPCSAPALVLIVMLFCKIMTEFSSNTCLVFAMLPHIARVSVIRKVHPYYLMMAATLASSVPFHLETGTPGLAMVAAYVHISRCKMMFAGIGATIIAMTVILFTVTLWSKVIWMDINTFPKWAENATILRSAILR